MNERYHIGCLSIISGVKSCCFLSKGYQTAELLPILVQGLDALKVGCTLQVFEMVGALLVPAQPQQQTSDSAGIRTETKPQATTGPNESSGPALKASRACT